MTDLEQKSEKVLAKLTKIISNMTQLEDMFSIQTPMFILIHKKSNISSLSFEMEIENNTFQLPDLFYLINNKNKINDSNLITLKVNDLIWFEFYNEETICPVTVSSPSRPYSFVDNPLRIPYVYHTPSVYRTVL